MAEGTNGHPAEEWMIMKQIANKDSSNSEGEKTGSNVTGLQKTGRPMGPMTVEHEQWDEFVDELLGADGCDFHLLNPNDSTSAAWTCDGTDAFPISRRILADMGLTPAEIEESIAYFKGNGGFCDCETFLNVDQFGADKDGLPPLKPEPLSRPAPAPAIQENESVGARNPSLLAGVEATARVGECFGVAAELRW